MNKFTMLVGLPASGKSTYAKEIANLFEEAVIVSSDDLRVELFGDVEATDKESNQMVFQTLHKRVKELLLSGKNVIYDATNINSNRRKAFLKEISNKKYKNVFKECVYFSIEIQDCYANNSNRNRHVPSEVIDRMYKTFNVPMYNEGWDNIQIIHKSPRTYSTSLYQITAIDFKEILDRTDSYDIMTILKDFIPEFEDIYEVSQDSSYHTFSISRHIYHVFDYVKRSNKIEGKNRVLYASLFHDIAKGYCKNFNKNSRYANFKYHENIGSQWTIRILKNLGYEDDFIIDVAELVQLHMKISYRENNSFDKLLRDLGDVKLQQLILLRNADKSSH